MDHSHRQPEAPEIVVAQLFDRLNDGSLEETIDWIRGQTGPDTILAHGQPWPYTFFTGRPTVLLPYRLGDSDRLVVRFG